MPIVRVDYLKSTLIVSFVENEKSRSARGHLSRTRTASKPIFNDASVLILNRHPVSFTEEQTIAAKRYTEREASHDGVAFGASRTVKNL